MWKKVTKNRIKARISPFFTSVTEELECGTDYESSKNRS